MAITKMPQPPQPDSKPIEQKPWRETPLIESAKLSKAAGCSQSTPIQPETPSKHQRNHRPLNRRSRIHLKLETLQPSGSFKSRGIGQLMLSALSASSNPSSIHFYSSSGGNAGLACVTAARALNRPATVVVPLTTKPAMMQKIRDAGAWEVLQCGETWREADAYLRESVIGGKRDGEGVEAVYVPPFDNPEIWRGNATVLEEIAGQLESQGLGAPDAVVCSVGGGGLFNGVVQGIMGRRSAKKGGASRAWERTQVLAVETKGADSLALALERGEQSTLPAVTSQATSLGCSRVSSRTFELASEFAGEGMVKNVVLSDAEAAMGSWRFADDERVLVELACGVSLAVCYGGRLERCLGRKVSKDENIVIVVCGGSNVSLSMIEGWRAEYGAKFEGEVDGLASDCIKNHGINSIHGHANGHTNGNAIPV